MQISITRLVAVSVVLLLTAGCAVGVATPLDPAHADRAPASGSASDGIAELGHSDHAGHEHADGELRLAAPTGEDMRRELSSTPYHGHIAGGHGHGHAPRRLLRTNLRRGWCAPAEHSHASACGTPLVHGLLTEPAFLGRDLFFDVTIADGETQIEAEIEWSLTKRIGLIAELPYTEADTSGVGDAGLGIRALLVEERRFLFSASMEAELPTGSESRGLGSGSVALGANLHTWVDLGSWVTLQTVSGLEHVPDGSQTAFTWSAVLAKSFRTAPLLRFSSRGGHDHGPATFNLLAEIQGATALSQNAGTTEGRWLLGASYRLARDIDVRGAFSQSFGGDEEEDAWTVGFNLLF